MQPIKAKAILTPKNGIDIYRGCTHGCIYCDGRSDCFGMTHRFENIEARINAPELLSEALSKKRKPTVLTLGVNYDPYQPAERELELARKVLAVIAEREFGVTVCTRSDLLLRDIDLLSEINRKAKCVVNMSFATVDDALASLIEPAAPSPSRRIAAMRALADHGIPTVMSIAPILPLVTDTEENLRALLYVAFDLGVVGILAPQMGISLRSGSRESYYDDLDVSFPGLSEQYIRTYGGSANCESPDSPALTHILRSECRAHGVMYSPDRIAAYLCAIPEKYEQMSLF